MEILQTSKFFYKYICSIYLEDDSTPTVKYKSYLINVYHIINVFIVIYGSIMKFYYEKNTMLIEHKMFVLVQLAIIPPIILSYTIFCFRKSDLDKLVNKFQKFVNKRLNDENVQIYETAEWRSNAVAKWMFIVYCVMFLGTFSLMILIYLIYSLKIEKLNLNHSPFLLQIRLVKIRDSQFNDSNLSIFFISQFTIRLPYQPYESDDIKTYLFHCFLQISFGLSCIVMFSCGFSLFFSFKFYLIAFCDDFLTLYAYIDKKSLSKARRNQKELNMLLIEAFKFEKRLIKYVQLYINSFLLIYDLLIHFRYFKRTCKFLNALILFILFYGAANFSRGMFLVLWVCIYYRHQSIKYLLNPTSNIIYCSVFFFFIQSWRNIDLLFIYYVMVSIAATMSILPFCYGASYTVESLENCSNRVYNSLWYNLTTKQQYYIKFLLFYSQQKYEVKGYISIPLSIEIFSRVKTTPKWRICLCNYCLIS